MDIRVKKTKRSLKNAMIKLLKEKEIERITITELCSEAEINRSTYYTYFSSPAEQLEKMTDEFTEGIIKVVATPFSSDNKVFDFAPAEEMCRYFKENREFYLAVSRSKGTVIFTPLQMERLKNEAFGYWRTRLNSIPEEEKEYIFSFSLGGSITIIENWLKNDIDKLSVKEVAGMVLNYLTLGFSGAPYLKK